MTGQRLRCHCGSTKLFAISCGWAGTNIVPLSATKAERARLSRGRPARAWCEPCWRRAHKKGKASA